MQMYARMLDAPAAKKGVFPKLDKTNLRAKINHKSDEKINAKKETAGTDILPVFLSMFIFKRYTIRYCLFFQLKNQLLAQKVK